mmetsp:Transcript_2474/g.5408  ORF Transcript_2474/g.5408 Transcript_2474/m.5408 type:complete len:115 (+) Transcript_2474:321-665(+)
MTTVIASVSPSEAPVHVTLINADRDYINAFLSPAVNLTVDGYTTEIVASNVGFVETIPSQLGLLTSLTRICMFSNQTGGSIPSELGLLTNLVYLQLSENQMTGTIATGYSPTVS